MFFKRHAQTLLQTGTFQTVAGKGNFIQKRWVQLFVIIKTHSGSGLMWLTQQTVGATRYSIISTLSIYLNMQTNSSRCTKQFPYVSLEFLGACLNSSNVWNSVACWKSSFWPSSKSSFWPSSIATCSSQAFVPTLLLVSQPVRACIAGMVCTGIANFAMLFPATIQSFFNPE